MPPHVFKEGDRLFHRFNRDLGPGVVRDVVGRRLVVFFARTGTKLTLAADDSSLKPLPPGSVEIPDDPLERLKALDPDRAASFRNRLDGALLSRVRQARGLGSFLGGRIRLHPHQLHVAERATASDPVRWLLADEVGLGKTIEACLILSRLLRTERADRTLVVAPATLTVQWLGELYRKFHQTFILLDKKRREDVVVEHGEDFNPFEAHRHAIVALEDLVDEPGLSAKAEAAGLDLLVVDEAHRLERPAGEIGSDAYRAVAPLTRAARHVLLLSATPLEADTHGFFRLLELLRPEAYTSEEEFQASLREGRPLPPCTSATRRVDIGGLMPRVPLPVDLRRAPARDVLTGDENADADDPRVEWLSGHVVEGKTLVFVHEKATLTALKGRLESATRKRVAIFHEDLTPERGDVEVAEFRRADGPQFLISTEAGGEGRNFEFCKRLVLFDLPLDPAAVEQRIGRLDRISRTMPVEIVYFRPPDGFGAELVSLYEKIGVFREPLGGLERSLAHVEAAIRKAELAGRVGQRIPLDDVVSEVREAAAARQTAMYHHLHRDGYRPELAQAILARIPAGLDDAMERFVLAASDLYGFDTAERAAKTWYIEFGAEAILEHLPGVPGGTRYLGTFDREEAVRREELDFFASGHPLVEGIFRELEDGTRGRVAFVKMEKAEASGAGLLFIYEEGADVETVAIGLDGVLRPAWARLLLDRRDHLRGMNPDDWKRPDWPGIVKALARRAPPSRPTLRLSAVAGFRLVR